MSRDRHIQELLTVLIRAVEVSLAAREAARAAVAEMLRRTPETGISLDTSRIAPDLVLTPEDRAFLSSLSLRLEDF